MAIHGDDPAAHAAHETQGHAHRPGCGHPAVEHEGHMDYLHGGHLHHMRGERLEEHSLAVDGANPAACTPDHACGSHDEDHVHGPACGHPSVPHGDHEDYLVDGHLHHPHGPHCDAHGEVRLA